MPPPLRAGIALGANQAKQHAMPCHHALAEALHAYIDAAGIVLVSVLKIGLPERWISASPSVWPRWSSTFFHRQRVRLSS
jgi:hypothetical protein